ncbi:hypothetical protein SAMN04487861_10979 [Selenomonas ruminantium]|uniref:Uncharacterized protein n=1 Tax=Selenomonas ruminantium TaxID=971 RepID=A0A1I3EA15_SELRU|nr:hypothetical protein [Selenomonas ruminantium]SFH95795.1 hypothetical protein SAMN04487861_10979 [Selenomonas ruminantium]
MRYKNLTATALTAFSLLIPWSSGTAMEKAATPPSATASLKTCIYQQAGLYLRIPRDLDHLLLIKTGSGQQLFSVAERASVEAAKKEMPAYDGAGWLFAIGKVTETELHEMLCADMSGRELFAQDQAGSYFIFYHPTDVRYMRESADAMRQDQETWSKLCAWAHNDVPQHFIADNGLIALTADNSPIGIHLARISYKPATKYTLAQNDQNPRTGNRLQAASFVNMLLYGNTFETVPDKKAPQGELVTLTLPGEKVSLAFFQRDGSTYVLESRPDGEKTLYQAIPREEHAEALAVMQDWYTSLAQLP